MISAVAIAAAAAASPAPAEALAVTPLSGKVAWIQGASCNVVVVPGDTGLLLIDDQRIGDYDATRAALDRAYHRPVTEVINTHWHLDHAGGNAPFAQAGALIVAQANVRARLSAPQVMSTYHKLVPASPSIALPRQTYDARLTFRFGGETVTLVHVPHAHTDGDTIVRLVHANVLHMGDVFFNGMFPFIDLDAGGSIQGMIRALDVALAMSDARTRIVPGHGAVATRAELAAWRAMLADVAANVRRQVAEGRDLATVVASKPAASYRLAGDEDRFVAAVYAGYARPGTPTGS
jgi:cyclase